jgi:hypothetical protein
MMDETISFVVDNHHVLGFPHDNWLCAEVFQRLFLLAQQESDSREGHDGA